MQAALTSWSIHRLQHRRSRRARVRLFRYARRQIRASYSQHFFPSTSRLREEYRLCSCDKFLLRLRLIANERPDFSPEHGISNVARFIHIEHHDGDLVVHAKTERG